MFAYITARGIVSCCDRGWISSTTNKSYRKIIWLSWNCVSTIPQVRTRTLRTSTSVGTYLGAMIRLMFSKKLEQGKTLVVWFIFILIIYQVWKTNHENCISNINGYCFHPVASKTKRCSTSLGLTKTRVHIYVCLTSFPLGWSCK